MKKYKEGIELEKISESENQPVSAFIMFKSTGNTKRTLEAFDEKNKNIKEKIIVKGQPEWVDKIKVEQGLEPQFLIWNNFRVSEEKKRCKKLGYFIFVFIMVIICVFIISFLKDKKRQSSQFVKGIKCVKQVNNEYAFLDYNAKTEDQNGDFHCYCYSIYLKGTSYIYQQRFPDGQTHCIEWYNSYFWSNLIIYFTGTLIAFFTASSSKIV